MATKKKGGFINRLIMGSEKSETYARSTLPSNRWGLFWDIIKTRFTKLILINLLMLLFLLPVFAILLLKTLSLSSLGMQYPFSQNVGIGYPAFPLVQGLSEAVNLQSALIYCLMPVAAIIGAVGISGGFYIMRNIVWTEGIFVANDFWRGIKLNFKQIVITAVIYSLLFWLSQYMTAFANYAKAIGSASNFLLTASIVCNYIIMAFVTIMVCYMLTICVTYQCSYFKLIKNAFLLTLGLLPQNLFFMFLGLLPVIIMLIFGATSSILGQIGLIIFIFFGPVLFTLVWTDYSQWVFDKFINDKVPGAKKNRGIYEKVGKSDSKSLQQYKEQMEKFSATSVLAGKPIKPITDEEIKLVELPTTFNRADLKRLQESKQAMIEDNKRYIEEHMNDKNADKNTVDDSNVSDNTETENTEETSADKKDKK